ncbi:2-oxo-4-hydroxy-4-carboxy--5-ureidoimidazoline (OHCU) decarboxylase [Metschnikowia aff. pulcherrima]|uniref:2-oxo-4-hydroxy-4-carboxy--5-ureidoimidazoline (OHCU) decarboxylase n=1 Tax=Metschnikowia aff. pulcherrima TaxID=2163413 RepID=A0A4V1ADN9_9ASCO|nr:2-oxo-4-hydroxy-4-carboxy--5-ureidoimidazoline (OHCU) decarboxylase [Metschnikowia aff. pulcherrima]
MPFQLPPSSVLHTLSRDEKVEVLDHLFEPCSTLAGLLTESVMTRPYANYREFIELAREYMLGYLQEEEQKPKISPDISKIILAHPRLGPSKDSLSSHSASEQKSLAGSEEEAEKLRDLNQRYEETFPGLRYVVFVNGRSRNAIMENMQERIARNDILLERREAFGAMCDIACDRARKLGAKL